MVPDQLVPRVSRAVRPIVRTGFRGECTGSPALSLADGGGGMAGAPSHERGTWTAPTQSSTELTRTSASTFREEVPPSEAPKQNSRTEAPQPSSPREPPSEQPRTELVPHQRTTAPEQPRTELVPHQRTTAPEQHWAEPVPHQKTTAHPPIGRRHANPSPSSPRFGF